MIDYLLEDAEKNVAVVLSGAFTTKQKESVRKRMQIRLEKVIAALHWLSLNNRYYFELTFDEIESLTCPEIETIDTHEGVPESESVDEGLEATEEFRVVFPNHNSKDNGCQGAIGEFKEMVQSIRQSKGVGGEIEILSRSLKEIAPGARGMMCLLGFWGDTPTPHSHEWGYKRISAYSRASFSLLCAIFMYIYKIIDLSDI